MARPSARGNQIQAEPPALTTPAVQPVPIVPAATSSRLSWGWQLALFVWMASFVFLLLNDLLTDVVKLASRLF